MSVEVIAWGAGPSVVLVHGDVFGAEPTWGAQRTLAERYRLLLVNRRGFGRSADVEGQDFAVDAGDVAEVLGVGAHLVGHSYGGVVALLAAARRPGAVRSLTVLEPPAFALAAEDAAVQAFISRIKELLAAGLTPAQFLPRFVEAVGGDPGRLPRPLPPPLIRATSVQMHGRWPWEADVPLDALAALSFPKLVVSGGHSRLFDVICDVLEAALPAERAVLRGAGHSIPTLGQPLNDRLEALWERAGPTG